MERKLADHDSRLHSDNDTHADVALDVVQVIVETVADNKPW